MNDDAISRMGHDALFYPLEILACIIKPILLFKKQVEYKLYFISCGATGY